jgi:hypothetical protein
MAEQTDSNPKAQAQQILDDTHPAYKFGPSEAQFRTVKDVPAPVAEALLEILGAEKKDIGALFKAHGAPGMHPLETRHARHASSSVQVSVTHHTQPLKVSVKASAALIQKLSQENLVQR